MHAATLAQLIVYSKQLRSQHTHPEQRLWQHLRSRRMAGHKFRRQHPFPPYILDFYCHQARLCIELDGSQHVQDKNYDLKRDAYLLRHGIRTLRFWNNQVTNEMTLVLTAIWNALHAQPLTPTPSPRGRGESRLSAARATGERAS